MMISEYSLRIEGPGSPVKVFSMWGAEMAWLHKKLFVELLKRNA
jgi:hypothetical protein